MPRLDCRFQAAIAIYEQGLTGSATEVMFPSVQTSHDGRALDGLAAFETGHEHLKAMSNVREARPSPGHSRRDARTPRRLGASLLFEGTGPPRFPVAGLPRR